jgi:hypothetical protein
VVPLRKAPEWLAKKARGLSIYTYSTIAKMFIARDPNMIFSWELVMRKKDQVVLSFLGTYQLAFRTRSEERHYLCRHYEAFGVDLFTAFKKKTSFELVAIFIVAFLHYSRKHSGRTLDLKT